MIQKNHQNPYVIQLVHQTLVASSSSGYLFCSSSDMISLPLKPSDRPSSAFVKYREKVARLVNKLCATSRVRLIGSMLSSATSIDIVRQERPILSTIE